MLGAHWPASHGYSYLWNMSHLNVRFFISCGMFEICCFTSRTLVYVCSNRTPAAGSSINMINIGWKSTRATFNGPQKKSLRGLGLWLEYFCLPQVAKPSGFWSKLGTFLPFLDGAHQDLQGFTPWTLGPKVSRGHKRTDKWRILMGDPNLSAKLRYSTETKVWVSHLGNTRIEKDWTH